jgi:hypothetical protein
MGMRSNQTRVPRTKDKYGVPVGNNEISSFCGLTFSARMPTHCISSPRVAPCIDRRAGGSCEGRFWADACFTTVLLDECCLGDDEEEESGEAKEVDTFHYASAALKYLNTFDCSHEALVLNTYCAWLRQFGEIFVRKMSDWSPCFLLSLPENNFRIGCKYIEPRCQDVAPSAPLHCLEYVQHVDC